MTAKWGERVRLLEFSFMIRLNLQSVQKNLSFAPDNSNLTVRALSAIWAN